MANDEDDEIKDPETDEHEADPEEIDIPEGALLEEKEPDLTAAVASSSFSDEDHDEEEDPYESAFNTPVKKTDTAQLDPYGVGAPDGFEEEGDDFLDDEEDDIEADDSNAF